MKLRNLAAAGLMPIEAQNLRQVTSRVEGARPPLSAHDDHGCTSMPHQKSHA